MVCLLLIVVLSVTPCLSTTSIPDREVLETQHTTCVVTTEELVATAQATVTRVLKGLCNANAMEDLFQRMERQLSEQLSAIQILLAKLEVNLQEQNSVARRTQRRVLNTLMKTCGDHKQGSAWDDDEEDEEVMNGPRGDEILRYNSTIHDESGGHQVFTYYWRVSHVEYKITRWDARRYQRSPSFYVYHKGYRMYLRLNPRQNGGNMYIHAGLTVGEYDDSLTWPFKLKMRVEVLDQASDSTEDMSSRIWDPTYLCSGFNWQRPIAGDNYMCVGLGFPHDVIRSRNYIWMDSIVIKLTVYLA